MIFTSALKDIADALGPASKVVKTASTVPILSNVLITAAADGAVEVRGTDLEVTAIRRFHADVSQPGEITVPAKVFANLVSAFQSGDVVFRMDGLRAEVLCAGSDYKLNTLPAEDYPPLPAAESSRSFAIDGARFKAVVDAAVFAASTEESRGQVLMGALVEVVGGTFAVVATDGYKLARAFVPIEDGPQEDIRVIVPARALASAAATVAGSEQVTITLLGGSGAHMRAEVERGSLTVRLVDGQFPNYQQVFPKELDRRTLVNTEALLMALRRAVMIVGDRSQKVMVDISGDSLTLTGNSDITGAAREDIRVEHAGEPIRIAFNAGYLAEILGHIGHERTALEFLGPVSPCMITPAEPAADLAQRYLLMPLRE